MGLGNAAAAATATPHQNYLSALQQHQHQEYVTAAAQRLAELQASAGLVDPLALEGRSAQLMHPFNFKPGAGAHSVQGGSRACNSQPRQTLAIPTRRPVFPLGDHRNVTNVDVCSFPGEPESREPKARALRLPLLRHRQSQHPHPILSLRLPPAHQRSRGGRGSGGGGRLGQCQPQLERLLRSSLHRYAVSDV